MQGEFSSSQALDPPFLQIPVPANAGQRWPASLLACGSTLANTGRQGRRPRGGKSSTPERGGILREREWAWRHRAVRNSRGEGGPRLQGPTQQRRKALDTQPRSQGTPFRPLPGSPILFYSPPRNTSFPFSPMPVYSKEGGITLERATFESLILSEV